MSAKLYHPLPPTLLVQCERLSFCGCRTGNAAACHVSGFNSVYVAGAPVKLSGVSFCRGLQVARASGVGAVTRAGHCIKGGQSCMISGRPGKSGCTICTGALFCTRLVSILVPAGGCTRAVAPFAGVKVCTAIWANGVIGVFHRRLLSALYNAHARVE